MVYMKCHVICLKKKKKKKCFEVLSVALASGAFSAEHVKQSEFYLQQSQFVLLNDVQLNFV